MSYEWIMLGINIFMLASLDRLGGSTNKAFRRYGIPAYLIWSFPEVQYILFFVIMGLILSMNLDEIELWNWDEIFLYSFALAFCLWPVCGYWAFLVMNWWMLGIYLSNRGVFGWKLRWRWVEIGRGVMMGIAIGMPQLLISY